MNNLSIGKNGEEIARNYLIKQGYKILEMNKRFSRFCEIDIIALDKNTLVFCEVKTRKTNICGQPLEAITKSKYQNINETFIQNYSDSINSNLKLPLKELNHLTYNEFQNKLKQFKIIGIDNFSEENYDKLIEFDLNIKT